MRDAVTATGDGRPAARRISARAWWALQHHLRDKPRLAQRFTADDVLALGEDGLLRVKGLGASDVVDILTWARAKGRADRPGPGDDRRFDTQVARAREAADPVAEMERLARMLWWHMPHGGPEREHALGRMEREADAGTDA